MAPKLSAPRLSLSPAAFAALLACILLALLCLKASFPASHQGPDSFVVISEFEASNGAGIKDQDGDHSDWIELRNLGTNVVNLGGWFLTDNFHNLAKWRFPSTPLAPGGHLLVFASGKNRRISGSELHTNFKLNEAGEYLALVKPDGQTVAHDFFPKYPRQRANISYGLRQLHSNAPLPQQASPLNYRYFLTPTPGATNRDELLGLVAEVEFSRHSGLYESKFNLRLSTATLGADIYYTTNGDIPSPATGVLYTHALPIATTTVLRAAAFKPDFAPTPADSRAFVFLPDVLAQSGAGFPKTWGTREGRPVPAHYGMAETIVQDPANRPRLMEALESLPTLSVICDQKSLFDPSTGIYDHPMENGSAWERPAAVELLRPDGRTVFRVNCGLRIQGGWSRRPEESPKHSLRLVFKKDYGPPKLRAPLFGPDGAQEFDTLILRAGNNNSWLHWRAEERRGADYLRDEWMRHTMLAMGYPSARGSFVHLYLNGLYWGLYNLCERPAAPFVAANEGGRTRDYDSRNADKVLSGDETAWTNMLARVNAGLRDDASYQAAAKYLNLPELADYLILNFYGGNADWDGGSNWYAARRRDPPGKFEFFIWDGERTLEGLDVNSMDFDDDRSPPRLFHKLSENPEFRLLFADRVHRLFFNGGVLTPGPAARRYQALAKSIEKAVLAEAARWGSYRLDVQQYKTGPYERYTPQAHWSPEVHRLLTEYFPGRSAIVLAQFQARGLYPRVPAPEGRREGAYRILIPPEGAACYYTIDGTEPRLPGGAVSPKAALYSKPFVVAPGQTVNARARGGGAAPEWSALAEF